MEINFVTSFIRNFNFADSQKIAKSMKFMLNKIKAVYSSYKVLLVSAAV
jgi:hypothetical protein